MPCRRCTSACTDEPRHRHNLPQREAARRKFSAPLVSGPFFRKGTMSKVPMTVTGAQRLKAELQRLKTIERPAVIQAIAEARSHGDLSENADYDAAKERQGFIEGRINE